MWGVGNGAMLPAPNRRFQRLHYPTIDTRITLEWVCSPSRLLDAQILVFHFPGVVERVKRGVADQIPEGPFRHLAGRLAL